MHHQLTFTCNLKQSNQWQPICSEVKYGTHYLIYAKFIIKELDKDGKCEIEKIDLWLQNYTGAITIGIDSASIPKWGETQDGETEMFILKINIKALHYNPNYEIEIPRKELILERQHQMETIVSVVENHNTLLLDNSNQETRNKAIFVDEEFYVRDGEDIYKLGIEKGDRNCRAIRSTFYI